MNEKHYRDEARMKKMYVSTIRSSSIFHVALTTSSKVNFDPYRSLTDRALTLQVLFRKLPLMVATAAASYMGGNRSSHRLLLLFPPCSQAGNQLIRLRWLRFVVLLSFIASQCPSWACHAVSSGTPAMTQRPLAFGVPSRHPSSSFPSGSVNPQRRLLRFATKLEDASKEKIDLLPDRPRIIVVGGGPAGFMAAIEAGECLMRHQHPRPQTPQTPSPTCQVLLLEGSHQLLHKVRISGGGRCNVMHDASKAVVELVAAYPRGERELLGPLTSVFGPAQALTWFESRGVRLKTEADGRMFPTTDSSEAIVACLRDGAREAGVEVRVDWKVVDIQVQPVEETRAVGDRDEIQSNGKGGRSVLVVTAVGTRGPTRTLTCEALVLATGSSRHGHALARRMGHSIVDPIPSLFTLELADRRTRTPSPLQGLEGISLPCVEVTLTGGAPGQGANDEDPKAKGRQWKAWLKQAGIRGMGKGAVMESSSSNVLSSTPTTLSPLAQRGPLVITHTGLSGPAILRLSAFAARLLALLDYQASFRIDWLPEFAYPDVVQRLQRAQTANARKHVGTYCPLLTTTAAGETIGEPRLPRRLWARLVADALEVGKEGWREGGKEGGKEGGPTWGSLSPKSLGALADTLKGSVYVSRGKSIHKEEFTTAGGVALKEVDFKTFGSKRVEGLYFAGEILDVDGVTGGFNFMNCWSGGYIAGRSLAQRIIARDEDGKDGGREGQEGDRDTRGLGL